MSDPSWTVLSRRATGLPAEGMVEDVPDWLYGHLQEWLYRVLQHTDGPVMVLRPRHGLTAASREVMLRIRTSEQPWLLPANEPTFLDALDATVRWTDFSTTGWSPNALDPNDLESRLDSANSVWRVNAQWRGLERRIDPTVTTAATSTIENAAADAAEHLATAWHAAYGRMPDPDKAYDESVLAVEALLCPLVCPANTRRTLGIAIRDLRNQTAQWELAIGDATGQPATVARLVELLALLWEGQSRHAGSPNSRRQTQTEAEAAVHLAVTIVQWITNGVLRRKP